MASNFRPLHPARPLRETILVSLRATGMAMIATSATLAGGSLCYLPSSFRSLRDVGILLTSIVVSALLADLFFTPLMIWWAYKGEERRRPAPPQSEPEPAMGREA